MRYLIYTKSWQGLFTTIFNLPHCFMQTPYLGSPDNPKTAGIVCYITIIGWLIAYFALYKHNKNDVAAFQIRQTLLLHILSFILNLLSMLVFGPKFPSIVIALLSLGLFILWLIGLYGAVKGEKKAVPIIGEWAQTVFKGL